MGWSYRKSIRLGKHTRLNLSKSGIGISTGVKGARISVGPRGTRTTLRVPGTGISYTKTHSRKTNKATPKKGCGCCIMALPGVVLLLFSIVLLLM